LGFTLVSVNGNTLNFLSNISCTVTRLISIPSFFALAIKPQEVIMLADFLFITLKEPNK